MDKLGVLGSSRLFEMLSTEELEMLASLCQPRTLAASEVIFEAGDVGDGLFLLADGEVEVIRREGAAEKILATLAPPEFFGEMSVIDKEYRSATVRARAPTILLYLSVENLLTFRKSFRDGFTFIIINIARVLSQRLRETNGRLAARL